MQKIIFLFLALILSQNLFSQNEVHNKYKFSIGVDLGASRIFKDTYGLGTYRNTVGFSPYFGVDGMYYFSKLIAVKMEAGYTNVKMEQIVTGMPHETTYEGGNYDLITLRPSFVVGRFVPREKYFAYGEFGIGVQFRHRDILTQNDWVQNPDNTWQMTSSNSGAKLEITYLMSFGAAVGYRFTKNFGVKLSTELVVPTNYFISKIEGSSYMPVRVGVFYIH